MDLMRKIYTITEYYGDPRIKPFFLMDGPFYMLGITAIYLAFCLWIGPAIMSNRKPFKLHRTLRAYNILQVIICTWYTISGLVLIYNLDSNFFCEPLNSRTDYYNMQVLTYHWYYFVIKILDLLDTVFFVLRKKNSHITFLHLYHHSMVVICAWSATKFMPGAQASLIGLLNSFVHVCMYSYYYVASLGPKYRKYTGWKIWVTRLQIAQFLILFVHNSVALLINCAFPKPGLILMLAQSIILLYLFGNFYIKTYTVKCPLFDQKKGE
ncbi:GNS1/SUR4 family [Popillia japonica]|uniref:Elongation of very long chain fatty acids protein n=1 Tax=Popillia japonica TaxID=7064 RepID=A0AAW1LT87_POPJA